MAGPNVNRKWKLWKEISLRLRWSNSSCCNDAFALIFLFPTTLEKNGKHFVIKDYLNEANYCVPLLMPTALNELVFKLLFLNTLI